MSQAETCTSFRFCILLLYSCWRCGYHSAVRCVLFVALSALFRQWLRRHRHIICR
jgi:hypothetical protein